ncbi:putative KilA-N domain protein [Escherichia coli]|nr:putative KilA-N domain protein [Escherichia coli]
MNNLMVIDGIEVRRDAYGRYSLNDLHRAAVASGANARTKEPGKFLSSQQTVELVHELTNTQNLGVDPVSVIHGGNERGTYVCKELVYAYAMWISPSKLREKWDELSLRLSPSVSTHTEKREDPYFKASYDNVDYSQIPAGFRG